MDLHEDASTRRGLDPFRPSGGDARRWNERIARDTGFSRADALGVAEMQSVPRLIRAAVTFGMRRGIPPEVAARMLVLDRDDALWKRRLSVTTTDRCYVLLLDSAGRIRWMSRAAFGDDEFQALRWALGQL